jgi:hypothetical protein
LPILRLRGPRERVDETFGQQSSLAGASPSGISGQAEEHAEVDMPSSTLSQRIRAFLAGPQGRRLIEQGRRQLAKPQNQQRLQRVVAKLQGRRSRP